MNAIKTALLLGLLSGVLLLGGDLIAGRHGLYIAFAIAIAMNFFGYFFSDKMALAMYSAQPVTPTENSDVYNRVFPIVQSLCHRPEPGARVGSLHGRSFAIDERQRNRRRCRA
jgi:heat shock protein HtpX